MVAGCNPDPEIAEVRSTSAGGCTLDQLSEDRRPSHLTVLTGERGLFGWIRSHRASRGCGHHVHYPTVPVELGDRLGGPLHEYQQSVLLS